MEHSESIQAHVKNDSASRNGVFAGGVRPRLQPKKSPLHQSYIPPPTRQRNVKRKRQPHAVTRQRKAAQSALEQTNSDRHDKRLLEPVVQPEMSTLAPQAGDSGTAEVQGTSAHPVDGDSPDGNAVPTKKRRIRRKKVPASIRPQSASARRNEEFMRFMDMRPTLKAQA